MLQKIRHFIWHILGFDYQIMLNKTDFILLRNDKFVEKGQGTYDNGAKVWRWTKATLKIGNYCSIAFDVNFIIDEGYHKVSNITSYPFLNDKNNHSFNIKVKQKMGIEIGNDVWIGMGAFIMPGVKIGNGVTIAANSVVTRDIPDYVVVAGTPAKIIKHKFDDEKKEALNKIAWWYWTKEELEGRKLDFYNLTIEKFIEKYAN